MSKTIELRRGSAEARSRALRVVARAWFGIPVLLMCSCAGTAVKHYTLVPPGAPQPAGEAIFRASEQPAIKPFVRIDGHCFSVGSELAEAVHEGFLCPFSEQRMRSLEVRLSPGPHKVEVAIAYLGSWSLPFREARTIDFEAQAGKSYALQVSILRFKDLRATGNIEWGTKVIELETRREFEPRPDSPGWQTTS